MKAIDRAQLICTGSTVLLSIVLLILAIADARFPEKARYGAEFSTAVIEVNGH